MLTIDHPGPLSLLQDYGRYGLTHLGVSNGGPMDETAFLWANKLLNNHFNSSCIEIQYGGFTAKFHQPTLMAICGADMYVTLNEQPIQPWRTHTIQPGDQLKCGFTDHGMYAYLAVKNGFNIQPQLGSTATVMQQQLGGINHNGDKLKQNDQLPYQPNPATSNTFVQQQYIPNYNDPVTLHYFPNPKLDPSLQHIHKLFTNNTYQITNTSNRMGYRLQTNENKLNPLPTTPSQAILLGTIQLPPDGNPIVLMRDRQTTGGYPVIGIVTQLDTNKLAQCPPSTTINFKTTDIPSAATKLKQHLKFFAANIKIDHHDLID